MPISDSDLPEAGIALQLRTEHVVQALTKSNPGATRGLLERTGHIVTMISKAVLNDPEAMRRVPDLDAAAMSVVLREIASSLHGIAGNAMRPGSPMETERMHGAGLGEVIDPGAGLARLNQYATAAPLEDWAGPTWSADQVLSVEGVTADVLDRWRRSRAIVELEDRDHRSAFPAGQFSGHRPIPGLAEVQAIVGDGATTWLWLVKRGDGAAPSWLDLLRRGEVADVLEAARQDFR